MDEVLKMFKMDIGVSHKLRDTFFIRFLESQQKQLEEKGLTLDLDNAEDMMLLSDFSSWNYRKRNEDVGLSRSLSLRIRNRIVKERAKNE